MIGITRKNRKRNTWLREKKRESKTSLEQSKNTNGGGQVTLGDWTTRDGQD